VERQHSQQKKGGDGAEELGFVKAGEAGGQYARGNGSHWNDQRIFQVTAIVAWFAALLPERIPQESIAVILP
jgi:hypothetical protein